MTIRGDTQPELLLLFNRHTADLAKFNGDLAAAVASLPDAGVNGGRVMVRRGDYPLAALASLPSKIEIEGLGPGASIFIHPAGSTYPLLDLNGKSGVKIGGIGFAKAVGAALSGSAYSIRIRGNANDIEIDDVIGDGGIETIHVAGQDGTTPGTVTNLHLRRVRARNSPSLWGFGFDECDRVLLEGCHAEGHRLDGYKLRRKAKRVTLRDCNGIGNGVGAVGDGLDAYAGGNTLRIFGGDWSGNTGNGITIKTDSLSATGAATYGYVEKGLVHGVTAIGNGGNGVGVYPYYSGPTPTPTPNAETDPTTPLVALFTVSDCYAEGNTNYGYYLGGWGVVGSNLRAVANGLDGIYLTPRSRHLTLRDPICLGNSRTTANTRYGIYVADGANYITIAGGLIQGVHASGVVDEAAIAALTKYHRTNIYVEDGADHVLIDRVREAYSVQAQGIQTWGGAGLDQVVHYHPGASNPSAAFGGTGAFGGIGSTWTRSDATLSANAVWTKTSGLPNAPTAGWTVQVGELIGQTTYDWPSIANGAHATTTVTVTGAVLIDIATASLGRDLQGMQMTAYVSSANTVTVVLYNATGAAVDLISGTLTVLVAKVV